MLNRQGRTTCHTTSRAHSRRARAAGTRGRKHLGQPRDCDTSQTDRSSTVGPCGHLDGFDLWALALYS
jgi:hypothetical protein